MQEDEMLRRLVAQHGTKKWAHLATIIKSKKSKQVQQQDTLLLYAAQFASTKISYNHLYMLTHPILSCSAEEDGKTFRMQS